jgi:hypothetical protein
MVCGWLRGGGGRICCCGVFEERGWEHHVNEMVGRARRGGVEGIVNRRVCGVSAEGRYWVHRRVPNECRCTPHRPP